MLTAKVLTGAGRDWMSPAKPHSFWMSSHSFWGGTTTSPSCLSWERCWMWLVLLGIVAEGDQGVLEERRDVVGWDETR